MGAERDDLRARHARLRAGLACGRACRLGGARGAHRALLSDDNRATLAWSETRGQITRVFVELSGTGVRFGTPRLLERFTDPDGAAPPSDSPRLVRLLSER